MKINNLTNNGTINEVHDSVVAISPQGQQIQQNIVGQPQPETAAAPPETKPRKTPSKNKSDIQLRDFKGTKVNFIRVVKALHKEGFFERVDGGAPTEDEVFSAFGIAVSESLDNYSAQLSNNRKDNTPETRSEVFDCLKKAYVEYEQVIDDKKSERD